VAKLSALSTEQLRLEVLKRQALLMASLHAQSAASGIQRGGRAHVSSSCEHVQRRVAHEDLAEPLVDHLRGKLWPEDSAEGALEPLVDCHGYRTAHVNPDDTGALGRDASYIPRPEVRTCVIVLHGNSVMRTFVLAASHSFEYGSIPKVTAVDREKYVA
jgi:hypothetical protein